jgi:hypothetical protein
MTYSHAVLNVVVTQPRYDSRVFRKRGMLSGGS